MEISTPGRICLFGEHQDYLGLPVIAMAISLRVRIVGKKRKDRRGSCFGRYAPSFRPCEFLSERGRSRKLRRFGF